MRAFTPVFDGLMATKQSSSVQGALDCFASLAMTGDNREVGGFRNDAKPIY
jgi:hypothetical protein